VDILLWLHINSTPHNTLEDFSAEMSKIDFDLDLLNLRPMDCAPKHKYSARKLKTSILLVDIL